MSGQGTPDDRRHGRARTGRVSVRSFDEGVFLTMGASVHKDPRGTGYYLTDIPGVCPQPDLPGIPVVFNIPDDRFSEFALPFVLIRRDSVEYASQRMHPMTYQYRTAAPGASRRVQVIDGEARYGYDSYEQMLAAKPYDFQYTLNLFTRNRGGQIGQGSRSQGNLLMEHLVSCFKPDGSEFFVQDSVGDWRSYWAFLESIDSSDELGQLTERTILWIMTVRVIGELDFESPETATAITQVVSGYDVENT